ncbi:hypothetical protein HMI54_010463 [Coelomomyces lativittatus]|nr:hypothetical protein HMI54_010463 [Coelomomyces lativittatus]KAJ1502610.1 hypothetical protein HMI56_002600 [Coelomomyces lativittatus]KAJ1502846.1 hypothetical protein HMI55_002722 [Coelomomyces lativittatus]
MTTKNSMSSNIQKITLTSQDIVASFNILSQNNKRVTKEHIQVFLKTYFPNLPPKLEKLLLGNIGGQKTLFKLKELQTILRKKENASSVTYNDLAKIFEFQYHSQLLEGYIIDTVALKLLIEKINESLGISLPQDLSFVLKTIDLEHDRHLSIQKWNQIGSHVRKQT